MKMVGALKDYVKAGGKLPCFRRRCLESGLALNSWELARVNWPEGAIYNVQTGAESVQIKSATWRLVDVTTAKGLGTVGKTPLLTEQLLPNPSATLNQVGNGRWLTFLSTYSENSIVPAILSCEPLYSKCFRLWSDHWIS